jgi:hypothetical protein
MNASDLLKEADRRIGLPGYDKPFPPEIGTAVVAWLREIVSDNARINVQCEKKAVAPLIDDAAMKALDGLATENAASVLSNECIVILRRDWEALLAFRERIKAAETA